MINYASILNEINKFVHRERLNVRDQVKLVCDSLDSMDNIEREIRSGIPASKMVSSLLLGDESNRAVLNQAALRLGVSLRQTEDELVRNMLASTASQINCIGGTNGDSPTNITLPDISRMTALLLNNNGYMFTSSIEGDDKFGTAPVRNAYIALCNTALTNNLNQVTNFIPQSAYPSQQRVLESEWGAVNNVRFLVSSIGSVTPNASAKSANVYNVITCAKEAYACIKQDGASAQFIYRPAYLSGPLAQNVTVGWKMAEVPRILNDAWLGNLRCTIL